MKRRDDADFRREIDAHIAIETDRLIAEGHAPADARRRAARIFGNVTAAQERFYESRRMFWIDELRRDLRYAFRVLRRAPGFAAAAVGTLALGIGATAAIFSVINAVVLKPLAYRDPESLVLVQAGDVGLSAPWAVAAWREHSRTLVDLAGFSGPRPATLVSKGEPAEIDAADVTWNFLSLLGVTPALGRGFVEADAARGAPAVALLSHELWRSRFGGDPGVIGTTVHISGVSGGTRIVGVTSAAFRFPAAGALPAWGLPIDTQPDVLRVLPDSRPMNVVGRLATGTSAAAVTTELATLYRQAAGALREDDGSPEFPQAAVDRMTVGAASLQERLIGDVRQRLWLTMGAASLVLLIACANVANLLLARASARQREIALRAALGAGRRRLARLALTESGVLALLGSVGGVLLAAASGGLARTLLADRIPHVGDVAIDATVLAFAAGVAAATGILCGLALLPGLRRVDTASMAGDAAATVTGRSLMRRALLSSEVAVTVVLVVAAALLARTLWNLAVQDKGFDPDRTLTVRVAPGIPRDLDPTAPRAVARYWAEFFTDVRVRLLATPGVESAGAISLPPLAGTASALTDIALDGRGVAPGQTATPLAFVTPGYLRAMRIPVTRGRDFDDRDRAGAEFVAIVNEAFVRRYSPRTDVLGARVTSAGGPEVFTIVGVTKDVPDWSLRRPPVPMMLASLAQMPATHIAWGALTFVLRTADADPLRIAPDVRRTVWAINPDIVISEIATMEQRVAVGMRAERDAALLFGLFAVAALVLAAIGVYGVAAYAMVQRTREIGIRMALGAGKADVSRVVVSQVLWPAVTGVAIGIGGAAAATRLVASMIYGVTPLDAETFAAAAAVLLGVALLATWMPARRAMRIDPLAALRHE